MEEHGISVDRVVQHNYWNGKDCPKTIRATAGAWEAFLALCRGETANVSKLDTDVDTLANVGNIDQPDYWKAGNYSKGTVEALIGKKTADYVPGGRVTWSTSTGLRVPSRPCSAA